MKVQFNNLHDVFKSIKSNSFNREYAWEIANAYIFEENNGIEFDDKLFDGFGFLFQFLLTEQFEISDEEFKNIIENLLDIDILQLDLRKIKKVLYEKKIDELKVKFDKKCISDEVYKNQINKYLG